MGDTIDHASAHEAGHRDPGDADALMLAAVTAVLETRANPAIARHGGRVTAERVENGVVSLRMSGGCQGCAASARTLRLGVEKQLRAAVPGIRAIVDVTDHDGGASPYYRAGAGAAQALFRPVPDGALTVENGQILLAPEFLAPRLGLSVDALEAGVSDGQVATQHLPGAVPGQSRIVVRSQTRAWAAEILADGSAHEIPPPRPRGTVRAVLTRLTAGVQGIARRAARRA